MKLTPWFSGDTKPVREGLYQIDVGGPEYYSYWDGKLWYSSLFRKLRPGDVIDFPLFGTALQNQKWRGILK